jgi:peroxiredoxin
VADRLVGTPLPSVTLESTEDPSTWRTSLPVLFVHPHATGLPDPPVAGWDLIPGARGCTSEACGFRDHHQRLRDVGAEVAGLSVQTVEEQHAFADRVGLHFRLISDPDLRLAAELGVPRSPRRAGPSTGGSLSSAGRGGW